MKPDYYNDKIIDDTLPSDEYFEATSKAAVKSAVKFLTENLLQNLNVAVSYEKLSGVDYGYVITVREKPDGNVIMQRVFELSISGLYNLSYVAREAMHTAVQIALDVREILMLREEDKNASL